MTNMTTQPCDQGVIVADRYVCPATNEQVKRWTLAATILGSSMVFINGSTVNVALPAFQAQLDASVTDIQWIINVYTLMLASLILLGGSLGDRIGRKRTFLAGTLVFAGASIACGLAQTPDALILFRGLQGIGGALLTPGSLAILSAMFPPEERGAAIGLWSGFTALTAAFGPLLGGWLIDSVSWRWIFFIHTPLALAVLYLSMTNMPESRDEEVRGDLDWGGALLATIGLGSFTFGLITANETGWSNPLVISTVLIGLILFGVFLWYERQHPSPMVPLSLFKSRNFSGANAITLLLYTSLSGLLFFLPLNLQQVQGYSATTAGAALLPFILPISLLSTWSGGLTSRVGARLPLFAGSLLSAVGFALFALPGVGGSYWMTFFPAVGVMGLGFAVAVAPLTTTVMTAVPEHNAGTASGINNATSRMASLLAVALFGLVMLNLFSAGLETMLSQTELTRGSQQSIMERRSNLAAIQPPDDLSTSMQTAVQSAVQRAFIRGFRAVAIITAGLAFGSALISWFWVEDPEAGKKTVQPAKAGHHE